MAGGVTPRATCPVHHQPLTRLDGECVTCLTLENALRYLPDRDPPLVGCPWGTPTGCLFEGPCRCR